MTTTKTTETEIKTKRCACGQVVRVSGEPENRIGGSLNGRKAWWYGCTSPSHRGQVVAFGGYTKQV